MAYKPGLVCPALGPCYCRLGSLLSFCCVVCQEHFRPYLGEGSGIPRRGDARSLQGWQHYLSGKCLQAAWAACILTGCCRLPLFPACVSQLHKESLLLQCPSSGSHKQHRNSLCAGEKHCLCQLKTSSYAFLSSLSVYGFLFFSPGFLCTW